jgi:aerobic-type carbon monoxide dehydrogenase small subunit (CoxS/CutS family)
LRNCSITGSSALSGDSLASTQLANFTSLNLANASVNTATLDDASDWTFTGTCYNNTNSATEAITTITGVTINNTLPTSGSNYNSLNEAINDLNAVAGCGSFTNPLIFNVSAGQVFNENPNPTEEEVRLGLEGNLCRCTGYHNIVKSVLAAAKAK